MDNNIQNLTSILPEIKTLIDRKNSLKKESNYITRRLKTLTKKYEFLNQIVGKNIKDNVLERALTDFFRQIGYTNVKKVGINGKEDIQIIIEESETLILVEVTGTKKKTTNDDKTRQVTKHFADNRNKHKKVRGLFIVNHDFEKIYSERIIHPFSEDQIKYAKDGDYSLVTTFQLLVGFIILKTKQLSLTDFTEKITKNGEIIFYKND